MEAFVITSLALCATGVLIRFGYLAWADYPRAVTYTRGEEVFQLLISLAWCGWALWLLTR